MKTASLDDIQEGIRSTVPANWHRDVAEAGDGKPDSPGCAPISVRGSAPPTLLSRTPKSLKQVRFGSPRSTKAKTNVPKTNTDVPYPDPPFDDYLLENALRERPNLRKVIKDPAQCAIRVRDIEELLKVIKQDMTAYCDAHGVDDSFRHVCKSSLCPFDHKGMPHVQPKNASGCVKPLSPNMHLVVGRYVKPWTVKHKVSYAGALIAIQAARSQKPDDNFDTRASAFISHNWEEEFQDFVATALNALDRDSLVWVCSFMINQNKDIGKSLGSNLKEVPFARALGRADRVINFMDARATTLTRSWVVFETYLALNGPRKIDFHVSLPDNSDRNCWDTVSKKLQSLDVRRCQASKQTDHEMIMKLVAGKEDKLNEAVKKEIGRACLHAGALEAARAGTLPGLQKHPEPLCQDAGFTTTLHFAAEAPCEEALRYLIRCQADVTKKNKDGDVPLHFAARSGRVPAVMILLEASADISARNNAGSTPLHLSVRHGRNDLALKLIELGSAVNQVDGEGLTPMHCSAMQGDIKLAMALVKMGACIDVRTQNGQSPLHLAALNGHEQMVTGLVCLRATVDVQNNNGETALHSAAFAGNIGTVEKLVSLSAAVDARTVSGWSPLHMAAYEGFAQTAARLLELGALADSKTTKGGRTALHLAAASGHDAAADVLVKGGAALDARDGSDKTALHWAACNGHSSTVTRLVQLGLPINATDGSGKTALHTAAAKGQTATAAVLVTLGAAADIAEVDGRTPYLEACHHEQFDTAERLRELDAAVDVMLDSGSASLRYASTVQTEMLARLSRAKRRENADPKCSIM